MTSLLLSAVQHPGHPGVASEQVVCIKTRCRISVVPAPSPERPTPTGTGGPSEAPGAAPRTPLPRERMDRMGGHLQVVETFHGSIARGVGQRPARRHQGASWSARSVCSSMCIDSDRSPLPGPQSPLWQSAYHPRFELVRCSGRLLIQGGRTSSRRKRSRQTPLDLLPSAYFAGHNDQIDSRSLMCMRNTLMTWRNLVGRGSGKRQQELQRTSTMDRADCLRSD